MIRAKFTMFLWGETDEDIDALLKQIEAQSMTVFIHEREREFVEAAND